MSYEEQLKAAHAELSAKGVWKSNYNPAAVRMLRKTGLKMPPPYYQPFLANFLHSALPFSVIYGVLMWFSLWRPEGRTIEFAICMTLLTGVLFGLLMATFYFIRRKQLKLTKWEDLG